MGDKFRIRARQFPALVNCTMFDWFHGWPGEALVSVARRFLADVPNIDAPVMENIALHMAYAHQCVSEASVKYLEAFRRYNYTTPKSYLELISLYKLLLERKRQELRAAKERLQNGVEKIAQASAQVRPGDAAGCQHRDGALLLAPIVCILLATCPWLPGGTDPSWLPEAHSTCSVADINLLCLLCRWQTCRWL